MGSNLKFALNFLRRPARNASLVPSSRSAASAMLKGIDFSAIATIVELGPGTGVFTKEILKQCKPDARVLLIEIENTYAAFLERRFGDRILIERGSAHLLDIFLQKHGIEKVDLIVSGLPVFLPEHIRGRLLESVRTHTNKGAIFRFFTYNPPLMKRAYKDLPVGKISFVWGNVPPLWVYGIH